jgi:hypothetical protein
LGEPGGPKYLTTLEFPLALLRPGIGDCWGERHLFEKTWAKVAGELGESVYGLKDDFRPVVGDGMSWVAVAIPLSAPIRHTDAAAPVVEEEYAVCDPAAYQMERGRWQLQG